MRKKAITALTTLGLALGLTAGGIATATPAHASLAAHCPSHQLSGSPISNPITTTLRLHASCNSGVRGRAQINSRGDLQSIVRLGNPVSVAGATSTISRPASEPFISQTARFER